MENKKAKPKKKSKQTAIWFQHIQPTCHGEICKRVQMDGRILRHPSSRPAYSREVPGVPEQPRPELLKIKSMHLAGSGRHLSTHPFIHTTTAELKGVSTHFGEIIDFYELMPKILRYKFHLSLDIQVVQFWSIQRIFRSIHSFFLFAASKLSIFKKNL